MCDVEKEVCRGILDEPVGNPFTPIGGSDILVGRGSRYSAYDEYAGNDLQVRGKMHNLSSGGADGNVHSSSHLRILVDDDVTRAHLTQSLELLHLPTQTYREVNEFFAEQLSPACVIIASRLEDEHALNVVARCRAQWPEAAILVIAENPAVSFTVAAMRSGVDGILEKPINSVELIREVQTAINRSQVRCTKQHDREEARQRISHINGIESEILKLVAHGVANKNIAAAMSMSLRTVEKYRHSLFENLGVDSAAEATRIWVLANLED